MKPLSKFARLALIGTSLGLLSQAQAQTAKYGVACITNTLPRMAFFRVKAVNNYEVMAVVKGKSLTARHKV